MSSRKYNTNDNDLIWESFQNRTNHKISKQNSKYSELLENDLKYIEEFLIREGIWDKVKGAAGAAAGKVKDFAADKIMKPLMDMLAAAIQKDPASAEKLPELQQAAQGGGDIGAILQASGDQSIMKQIEGQPDAAAGGVADPADPEAAAAPQAESYLYQFNMNKMICEALVDQGIISESKSQIIQERYYVGAIGTLFNEANKPKDCPWMPNLIAEEAPPVAPQFANGVSGKIKKGWRKPAEAAAEAPAKERVNNAAIASQVKDLVHKATGGKNKPRVWQQLMKADKQFAGFVQKQSAGAPAAEAPATGTPEAPATGTPEAPAEAPATSTPEAPAAKPEGTPGPAAPTVGAGGASMPEGTPGPAAPTVGAGGASMPAEKPIADGATPAGGAPTPADGAKAPGILGKVWNFVKANKGAIGGLAAMGIAAALIAGGGPLAIPATRYLTGALIGGVRGAVKGATGTEGGFTDKLKGAANQAGADSIKGGAIGAVAGAAGDAVAGVGADAAAAEVDGATPSAAAEPYQPEPMDQTSDYGGNPEDYSAGGQYDMETPEIGGTSGGFNPETGGSNMDMSDEEAAAFNASQPMSDEEWANLPSQGGLAFDAETGQELPTDANGEVPGRDYQEPTAKSATEAEAGVGQIDPVTGKEIETIDPENKPGFFKKLGSLLPGGTKPREVFGKYTGKG